MSDRWSRPGNAIAGCTERKRGIIPDSLGDRFRNLPRSVNRWRPLCLPPVAGEIAAGSVYGCRPS